MRAIIPVAGVGSRLRPHTFSRPKVLLNVAGKPILAHILDTIRGEGIESATIIVGYMGDMIEEYVRANYGAMDVTFVTQDDPMGLGHSIYLARHTFGGEPALIILGDTIFDVDLHAVLRSPQTSLGVKTVDDPKRFGVVEMEGDHIARLAEKPEHPVSNLAVVGIYHIRNTPLLAASLEQLIAGDIRTRGEYQLTDALQMMIENGERMTVFHVEGWYDCGKPETLLATNRHLLEKQHTNSQEDTGRLLWQDKNSSVVIPPVFISPTAEIAQSVIGPYATIADGAVIQQAIIRDSIIDQKAHVARSLLDNSIVGANAVIKGSYKRINAGDSSEIEFY